MPAKLTITAAWIATTGLVIALLGEPPPTGMHWLLAIVMVAGSAVGLYGVTRVWREQ